MGSSKTIKDLGILGFIDEAYASVGGSKRLRDMLRLNRPKTRICKVFGISRPTLDYWLKLIEVQDHA
jgi:hypothetical protein